ncbi:MAG: hypothetical protein MHMPM18_001787 [Marteilia pararefringens]
MSKALKSANYQSFDPKSTIQHLKNLDVSHIALGSLLGSINIYKFNQAEYTENEPIESPAKFLDHKTTIHIDGLLTTLGFSENSQLTYSSSRVFHVVDIVKPRALLHSVFSPFSIFTLKYVTPFHIAVGGADGKIGLLDTRCDSSKFGPKNFQCGRATYFKKLKNPVLKSSIRSISVSKDYPNEFYYSTNRGGIFKFNMQNERVEPMDVGIDSSKIAFAGFIDDTMLISDEKGNITSKNFKTGSIQKLSLGHADLYQNRKTCTSHMKHQFIFNPAVPVARNSHICLFSSMLHYNSLSTFYHIIKLESSLPVDKSFISFSNAKYYYANKPILEFHPMRRNIQFNCSRAAPFHTSPIGRSNLIVVGYVSANAIINYFDDNSLRIMPLKKLPDTKSVNCVDFV